MTTWCHAMTSWHHIMTSHGVRCHVKTDLHNLHRSHHPKVQKSCFSMGRPWPLTDDLDLQTWDFIDVTRHTKFRDRRSNGSARRELTNRHTDRHTDGRDQFYTLDHWCGMESWQFRIIVLKRFIIVHVDNVRVCIYNRFQLVQYIFSCKSIQT